MAAAHEHDPGPILTLSGVRKSFGSQVVLRDVSMDFRRSDTTVILGPSGTGKSVLLKLIVGLLRPDRGEIRFGPDRVDQLSESALGRIRKKIGFLFQLSALFDSMTIGENLDFPLREHTSLRRDARRRKVRAALERVDLHEVERKFPAQLSGGQQKRAALARAIILEPELMLYDEPTTGLDPVRADGINRLIRRLQIELGVTGIVVTHDLVSAKAVADRVIMLDAGRIAADGQLSDLHTHPDPHVQRFMRGESVVEHTAGGLDA